MHQLRGFQRDVLFVVYGLDAPNGQEILDEMERSLSGDVRPGRLYSNLDDLVEMGLVRKARTGGRANRYELTTAGATAVESRHEWERKLIRDT